MGWRKYRYASLQQSLQTLMGTGWYAMSTCICLSPTLISSFGMVHGGRVEPDRMHVQTRTRVPKSPMIRHTPIDVQPQCHAIAMTYSEHHRPYNRLSPMKQESPRVLLQHGLVRAR